MVYVHPKTEAFLVRCSQPLTGVKKNRNEDDEKMVKAIRLSTPYREDIGNILHFIDCRPYYTAMGNKCMGKGTEILSNYENTDLHFCKIDNIHAVRNSLSKLAEVCSANFSGYSRDSYAKFHKDIMASDWMYYIGLILTAAVRQANFLCSGESLICHCSDGWDRTSQVVSLTKLLLDPYYRTRKGFAILVEQEWLAFGHKFSERCGHGDKKETNQRAPIFTQWIDCVWQIWRQFPKSFEFSEEYLIAMVDEIYACRFGTFLFDCVKEREENNVKKTTVSLWSELCHPDNRVKYYNPLYSPCPNTRRWMFIDCSALKIRLWERFHLRYNWASPVQESKHESIAILGKKIDILTDKLRQLNVDVDALFSDQTAGKDPFHDPFHQYQQFVDVGGLGEETSETKHKSANTPEANRLKLETKPSPPTSKSGPSSLLKKTGIFKGLRGTNINPRHKASPTHTKSGSQGSLFPKKGIQKSNSFTAISYSVSSTVSSSPRNPRIQKLGKAEGSRSQNSF